MSWFDKLLPPKIKSRQDKDKGTEKKAVPEGLWRKCTGCGAVLYSAEIESNSDVCPKCDYHMRIGARRRLDLFLDKEPRTEIGTNLSPVDALKFKDTKKYKDRLLEAQRVTGEKDALVVMRGAVAPVHPRHGPGSGRQLLQRQRSPMRQHQRSLT